MSLIYMIPFFLNTKNTTYAYELNMTNEFLESLKHCDYDLLLFYNQGPFTNGELYNYLSAYNLNFDIIGSGINIGIVKARYIMTKYIAENYPNTDYVAEVHLDMIFPPHWEKPLIKYLEETDEPLIAPRIVFFNNVYYHVTGKAEPIDYPSSLPDKIKLLDSFKEDLVMEGFVHPVIHKFPILNEISPYDIRFFVGKQGYEDDSILLGYSYYLGTKNKWHPKINFNSCVYHKKIGQRTNIIDSATECNRNLVGLKAQYGAFGFLELYRIHHGNTHFYNEFSKCVISKTPVDDSMLKSISSENFDNRKLHNLNISRYFLTADYNSNNFYVNIPQDWWSRKFEYTWAKNFVNSNDVCLDAGCGIEHPFKFFLGSTCKEVHACDSNFRIEDKQYVTQSLNNLYSSNDVIKCTSYINNINFKCCKLSKLPYADDYFDKVYCISLLHLLDQSEALNGLKELYRVLKKDGLIIITVDVPTISLESLTNMIKASGFNFKDELIRKRYSNSLYSNSIGGLYCFRIVLTK